LCSFISPNNLSAQKSQKQIKKELKKERKKKAREEALRKRELALYEDSDFMDGEEDMATEEQSIQIRIELEEKTEAPKNENKSLSPSIDSQSDIERYAFTLQGIPYRYGGMDKKGFDCSGFSYHVYAKSNIQIPRTAQAQYDGSNDIPLRRVQRGDLIFFGKNKKKIEHVGMVVSNPGEPIKMIHSSSSRGIIITDVDNDTYWKPKLIAAGRYAVGGKDRAQR